MQENVENIQVGKGINRAGKAIIKAGYRSKISLIKRVLIMHN